MFLISESLGHMSYLTSYAYLVSEIFSCTKQIENKKKKEEKEEEKRKERGSGRRYEF